MQTYVCPAHPKYRGVQKPTHACENCWSFWASMHPALVGPTLAELYSGVTGQTVNEPPQRAKRGALGGKR